MNALMPSVLVITLGLAACSAAPAQPPTLCQLGEHREAYAGQSVTIEGYLLVSRHGSSVSDPRCGLGVAISWRSDTTPGLSALSAITERSTTERLMVKVRITGQMRQDLHHEMAGEHPWLLYITDARVLDVQSLAAADAERYLVWAIGPSTGPFQHSR